MDNKKIVSILLGLLVVIAVTPFVFSKISNSKIDEEVLSLVQNEQVKIKEVKSEIGYLDTKREFEITISNKSFPKNVTFQKDYAPYLDKVVVDLELSFKNLPVTSVIGNLKLKDIRFVNMSEMDYKEFNRVIKDKIAAVVTTSNFKDFDMKFKDLDIDESGVKLGFKGLDVKSFMNSRGLRVATKIDKIYFMSNRNKFEVQSIVYNMKKVKDVKKYEHSFDFAKLTLNDDSFNSIEVDKFKLNSKSEVIRNLLNGEFGVYADKFIYKTRGQLLTSFGIDYKFKLAKVDFKKLEKLVIDSQYNNSDLIEKDTISLLDSGFDVEFGLKLKKLKVMLFNLGDNNLKFKLAIEKKDLDNIGGINKLFANAIKNKDYSKIKMELSANLSAPVYAAMKQYMAPESLNYAVANHYIVVNSDGTITTIIETKDSNLIANGNLIDLQ